mgnify:FL=1
MPAAGYLTTHGATAILNQTAHPAVLYARGHLGNPGPDALLNDAAESRRVSVTLGTAAAGAVTNVGTATIALAGATEDWTHLSLWDASSVGNPWWIVELPAPLSITAGETIGFAAGALALSFELWS